MQKIYTLIFILVLCIRAHAQTDVIIPAANNAGTGSTASLHRKPFGSNRSYERTALKYTHNEIGMLGNIVALGFYCDSLNNPGTTPVKIYIKEVTDSSFTPSTVATEESGATLVYNDTLHPPDFVLDSFITVTLSTPFLHGTTNNIEVIVETNSGGTNGSDVNTVSKGFRYFAVGTNRIQYWQSNTGSGTMPTGPGTLSNNRPNIKLVMTTAASCTAPPVAGTTIVNDTTVCAGNTVLLSLVGTTTGIGLSYQWISSPDHVTWTDITGATNATLTDTIHSAGYVACVVTCSGQPDTSVAVHITLNPFDECYCTQGIGGGCGVSAIDSVGISGTTLMNGATGCAPSNYISFPATGNTTASLTQGQFYTLTARFTGDVRAGVWIDFNQNGVFDPSEYQQICTTSTANTDVSSSLYIPMTALTGVTGMRIRSRVTAGTLDSTNACSAFGTGETEDYIITVIAATGCIAPPVAGTAVASADSVCSGGTVDLSLTGNSSGSGMTYQWFTSMDNGATWDTLPGATLPFYTDTVHAPIRYACVLTCSGQSDTSTSVSVSLNPFNTCYCTQGIGGGCTASAIDSVAIGGTTLMNGPTGCSGSNYAAYPASGNTTASLSQGQLYILTTRFTGNVRAGVWIDYNQNGVYDLSEYQQICTTSTANVDVNVALTIPLNALTGTTGMRIRSRVTAGTLDSTNACSTFGTGETEDYLVTIVPAVACTAPPVAGITVASVASACPGSLFNLSLNGNSTGNGMTFQWISSTDGGITWNSVAGATLPLHSDTLHTTTSYACVLTCSGMSDTSVAASISVNPFYDCYCVQGLGGNCTASAIDSVGLAGTTLMNGLTGCATNNYVAYPPTGNTTAEVLTGHSYLLTTKFTGNVRAGVWIDFNHNGDFDSTEYQQICTTSQVDTDVSITLNIPSNALLGLTGMRIRSRQTAGTMDSTNACSTFGSGETEDYIISINTDVGIHETKGDDVLSVFPNPGHGIMTLKQVGTGLRKGIVYDAVGETMYVFEMKNKQAEVKLNLSNLDRGIYFVRVMNEDGTMVSKKVVIQ